MAVLDHLGRRWTLRIAWELRDGPVAFREMQRRCGIASPNVLTARLAEAVDMGTVERRDDGSYALTTRGAELGTILVELDGWAERWARGLRKRASRRK